MNSKQADESQFLELVTENQDRILRVCRVYAWNASDQEDLYQEIIFQIWRGLPELKTRQFARTWLYRVAINTAMTFVRKRVSRTGRMEHLGPDKMAKVIESQQTTAPERDHRIDQLYSAIYKLDPLEKALVTLFLEDFTYEQIAEATGISVTHAGVMLHRARKKLFTLMNEEAAT